MSLDDIPQQKTKDFPDHVFEERYPSEKEMLAYLHGLQTPNDTDVEAGQYFQRNGEWVVRVRIGEDTSDDIACDNQDEDDDL